MVQTRQGKLFSIRELAIAAKVGYPTLWYRINHMSTVPMPDIKVGKRMYYSEEQFEELVALLGKNNQEE
jgi:hypothetical protein